MADTNSIRSGCVVCSFELTGIQKLYCGQTCKGKAYKASHPEKAASYRFAERISAATLKRLAVKAEKAALRRIARNWRVKPVAKREPTVQVNCRHCCNEFVAVRNGGLHRKVCDSCIRAKRQAERRIAKSKRRAILKGCASECVDPMIVFARDKWRCVLCGIKTPMLLRGTYEDAAPELDHIIPLSLGGPHTYINTQCACRRCNIRKSNKPLGQMLLVG